MKKRVTASMIEQAFNDPEYKKQCRESLIDYFLSTFLTKENVPMKHKEVLWEGEPEENPFQVGDRVRVYHHDVNEGIVRDILIENPSNLRIIFKRGTLKEFQLDVNWRQCRKLEEVKPREWYIDTSRRMLLNSDLDFLYNKDPQLVKVREVLEDES